MAVYKPYGKTASGKEEIKIPYSSIDGTPTIPTVHDGTLTIQKNGTTVKTFSANQSGNVTANITVPTKVGELENDRGFTSNAGTITGINMNGSSKGTSGVVDLGTVITALKTLKTNNDTAQEVSASEAISGSGTINLHKVAKTGNYNDLSNRPTIPTVNDGTLTIKQNGTTVQTFSANQSGNVTANITVPTFSFSNGVLTITT